MGAKRHLIKWDDFFERHTNKMCAFRVIPKTSLTNSNNNKKMWRYLNDMYRIYEKKIVRTDYQRRKKLGFKVSYREKDTIWCETLFTCEEGKKKIEFYLVTTELFAEKFKQVIESKMAVTLEDTELNQLKIPLENTIVQEMRYTRNDIFSLNTSAQEQNTPISTVLSTVNSIQDGDIVRLSMCNEVMNRNKWLKLADYAHEKLKQGKTPKRNRISANKALKASGKVLGGIVNEANSLILDTLNALQNTLFKGYAKEGDFKKDKLVESKNIEEITANRISNRTREKQFAPVWKSHIRTAVHSSDKMQRELLSNQLSAVYAECGEDNEVQGVRIRIRKRSNEVIEEMNSFTLSSRTKHDTDANIMSSDEIAKLNGYPTRELQREYQDELSADATISTEVNSVLTSGGISLGVHVKNKQETPVYMPTTNHDELCLPRVSIGGMGSGKTSFAASFMYESVLNGFGALSIDPAKGEIGDELEKVLPREQIHRIKLGDIPVAIDWREVKHSPKAKNRLANTVISFFNSATDEAGPQTARFIRAAVMGMQTGKLNEIIKILEDDAYRKEAIKRLKNDLHINTLKQLDEMSEARRAQVLSPIYNRLDTILGDEYLNECFNADSGLDMVEILSTKKAVIIDVPKSELGPEGVELIVNLLSTKIDLAMTLRKKQHPFFILFDEPHQFLKAAKQWKAAAVESRKWRLGYVWLFHSWEQIPRDLAEIIKAAGPHYHLYMSSKKTFSDLKEEIAPISIEEAMSLPRFHAINILKAGGITQAPFVAQMNKPPSMRVKTEKKAHLKVV